MLITEDPRTSSVAIFYDSQCGCKCLMCVYPSVALLHCWPAPPSVCGWGLRMHGRVRAFIHINKAVCTITNHGRLLWLLAWQMWLVAGEGVVYWRVRSGEGSDAAGCTSKTPVNTEWKTSLLRGWGGVVVGGGVGDGRASHRGGWVVEGVGCLPRPQPSVAQALAHT